MAEEWLSKLNGNPLEWMLESNPWTRYGTLTELMDCPRDGIEAEAVRMQVVKHPMVQKLVAEAAEWMPKAATRNNDPQLSYFKLRILADFGLQAQDDGIEDIARLAMKHTQDGFFACRGKLPERPKKGDKYIKPDPYADLWHTSPCNSPMISYGLLALGFNNDAIDRSVEQLRDLWGKETGWFCHLFFVESQFKKLNAGCPMAALMALEVFSLKAELKESRYVKNAYTALRVHKDYGKTLYYFGRSKKFWTLKYPYVWYNGFYLADVLSRFLFLRDSPLLRECVDWILNSQDEMGRFKATSIFLPYKHWDFGSKKDASPWITFLCCRILKRYYG
jgi:hypothetical protein